MDIASITVGRCDSRNTHLINHCRAVLPHLGHDILRCLLACCNLRLGGHCERVNESLGMGLADIGEQSLDEGADSRTGSVDSRNDLG
jgi:hypothetical protein